MGKREANVALVRRQRRERKDVMVLMAKEKKARYDD
jgi:hypothetical protein